MAKSADQVAAKWARALAAAGPSIEAGVRAVNTAPGQAAARQKNAYTQGVQDSADKWAARVAAVSVGEWQQATIDKGVPRIASGAQAAEPKFQAFMGQLLPFEENLANSLPARGGLEQNIERMTRFVRGMSSFSKR
jgi:hypothetical protein